MSMEDSSSFVGLESKIIRPLWEGSKLPREFALLVRVELAEVYMPAREGKAALSVRNYSMLPIVSMPVHAAIRQPSLKLTS